MSAAILNLKAHKVHTTESGFTVKEFYEMSLGKGDGEKRFIQITRGTEMETLPCGYMRLPIRAKIGYWSDWTGETHIVKELTHEETLVWMENNRVALDGVKDNAPRFVVETTEEAPLSPSKPCTPCECMACAARQDSEAVEEPAQVETVETTEELSRSAWSLAKVRKVAKAAVPVADCHEVTVSTRNVVSGSFAVRVCFDAQVDPVVRAIEAQFNVRAVRRMGSWKKNEVATHYEGGASGFYDRVLFYFEEPAEGETVEAHA